jgi:hypothetical protein
MDPVLFVLHTVFTAVDTHGARHDGFRKRSAGGRFGL